MGRRIVTGEEVRSLPEGSLLDLPPGAIVTDVAREWIEKRKIQIVTSSSQPARPEPVQLAIGSDHAGFEMKQSLAAYLREIGASFLDCGTHSKDPVDYPDFAHQVALAVVLGRARRGIVVDGAGIGSAMVANKVPGVRAAACSDETQARNAREHNDANVLTLGSRRDSARERAESRGGVLDRGFHRAAPPGTGREDRSHREEVLSPYMSPYKPI